MNDDPTCTARVTFSAQTPLRHFRQIDFIPHSLWPENYTVDPNRHKWQKWDNKGIIYTCIDVGNDGMPPFSIHISRYDESNHNTCEWTANHWDETGATYADPEGALIAARIAKEDWDAFVEHCIHDGMYGEEAFINKRKTFVFDYGVYVVQLKKAKLKYYSIWDPRIGSHHNYIRCTNIEYVTSFAWD